MASLGVPGATVRGWLRRRRARAADLAVLATRLVYLFDASLGGLEPVGGWPLRDRVVSDQAARHGHQPV
ncbi:MAG: hypothetical protein ACR2H3_09465 [Acidimicrobiales bacterium]